ncbi:DUF7130 family rubredoxin-like protein [Halosimplex pelagicum]|uniref:DUF7130 domain-containing protein n=1 Tax=Halosimplex pelagicum TaxID=869886 RepID=A0A7D5TJ78_9EURY|nr:hypothetical protein [Halosimplex pelagicum]QLH84616.1 hypothetical protein HZS54_24540 [Halosimplex pelagicum]
MSDDTATPTPIEPGSAVYDHEGNVLGVVAELSSEGFEVSITETIERVDDDGRAVVSDPDDEGQAAAETDESVRTSEEEHVPGQEFGEGYLMWRCENCGEMGDLDDGLPSECPNCGDENVIKWRED